MNRYIRRFVLALVTVHGLLHFVGAATGFGLVSPALVQSPITVWGGVLWLTAGLLILVAVFMMGVRSNHWWLMAAVAAVCSQAMVLTSWSDARAATVANVVLLLTAAYGFLIHGPTSDEARWEREVRSGPGTAEVRDVVTETDLVRLPAPLADYLRRSGAVGLPRVTSFYGVIHGRIRSGPGKRWMVFTGKQFNTFGTSPRRLFLMHAVMFGLPISVLHVFSETASMRARLFGLIPVMSAHGPHMTHAETVTLFNDLCVLAPAALVDAPVDWRAVDSRHVLGTFRSGEQIVCATLTFDDDHNLLDFVSDDRLRASPDGRSFVRQRWSTPLRRYDTVGGRRIAVDGEARWHAPAPEGAFTYLDFMVDGMVYNPDIGNVAGVIESADQEHRLATHDRS